MGKKKNALPYYIGAAVLAVITIVVIGMAFWWEQTCDLDAIYLWCRTHPTTFIDKAGGALVVLGASYQIALWSFLNDTVKFDKKIFNVAGILAFALGILLMWIK